MAKHRREDDEDKTKPISEFPRFAGELEPIKVPKPDHIAECSTGRDSAPEFT